MHFERNRHNTTLWAVKMDITVMDWNNVGASKNNNFFCYKKVWSNCLIKIYLSEYNLHVYTFLLFKLNTENTVKTQQ
jgi:hypothetical protein